MCLGATYHAAGKSGERKIAARDFYQGAYFTALEPGEIVTAVRIPVPAAGHGYAYEKLKRKIGDYATAAAAVVLTMKGGKVESCSIGLTNVAETPLWAEEAGKILTGSALDAATVKKADGRRRGDHFARHRRPRAGRLPHQDGGRHARPRPCARRNSAPALKGGQRQWPKPTSK